MVARVRTVAFQGIEAVPVDVQVMIAPGKVGMQIVGLPDKAVAESRERVQAALHASGLSMPSKKVTVNLAPADLPKEGSHYDLPIALGLMAALGAIPGDMLAGYVVLGELSLDGTIAAVAGALPAAIGANAEGKGLICPFACGPEAAWAGKDFDILAPRSLIALPPLAPKELLEVSMIASVAGELGEGKLTDRRPFRAPHHSASMAAMVGGGLRVRPGEVSLAHHGVLFLDELPEFTPQTLDALRQPLETGDCVIARANHRVTYPARIQLVAAMNPCRCGMSGEPGYRCLRGERCRTEYQARISGPLLDRIDLRIEVPAVSASDLIRPDKAETSAAVAQRVARARTFQRERLEKLGASATTNAHCPPSVVEEIARPDAAGLTLLKDASEKLAFSARAYHRVLKVARTLADLDASETVGRIHLAEAISYRMSAERMAQAA
ncbi:YifB family Mg chelatase-like AAA ATPase [Mesorhizobium sp. VK22B]|uniref:YifB family Mg chelatase-like AAA ATPase n=1 Tax=Mesorhizobium captivum TaxID=3072319 RepID=A0ABU4Z425_9HYPH|nr:MULTISPECIES: YifB family Mg chelatase-like AAA ATPase [unclassified Mesorhizobium]MDX8493999.1 YifB family Mg chelatase-like AAA ATPase [Mesorhizobium sp. VK22B]MDX8504931.1 YifB family Mg chelatase-like AAA ATPase [Mesorhizobium sp. VK22E]